MTITFATPGVTMYTEQLTLKLREPSERLVKFSGDLVKLTLECRHVSTTNHYSFFVPRGSPKLNRGEVNQSMAYPVVTRCWTINSYNPCAACGLPRSIYTFFHREENSKVHILCSECVSVHIRTVLIMAHPHAGGSSLIYHPDAYMYQFLDLPQLHEFIKAKI